MRAARTALAWHSQRAFDGLDGLSVGVTIVARDGIADFGESALAMGRKARYPESDALGFGLERMRRTGKHRRRTPKGDSLAPSVAPPSESLAVEGAMVAPEPAALPPIPTSTLELDLHPDANEPDLHPDAEPAHIERFFREPPVDSLDVVGELGTHGHEDDEAEDEARAALEERRRFARRRFTHIASIVIALSGLLCAIAFARTLVESGASATAAHASSPRPPNVTATSATTNATSSVLPVLPPSPITLARSTPPSSDVAVPAGVGPAAIASVSAAGSPLERDRAVARGERFEAQAALEIGDIRRANIVAQRAVAHDPSEANGWLLLVAAQLELKDEVAANRSLRACAKHATHGPRGECIALMQPR